MTAPTVLVTGAARGIGRATALAFARAGWDVGAYDVDTAALADLAPDLGPGGRVGGLDVRDPGQWTAALAELTDAGTRPLGALVNNAGVLSAGPFAEVPLGLHHRTVAVNLVGLLTGCHAAFPHLRPGSVVVNLASASATYGQPQLATYSATKAAVRGLTEALDLEWEPLGIRVVDVWPLWVDTDLAAGAAGTPVLRRLGVHLTPDDVAAAVLRAATRTPVVPRPHRAADPRTAVLAVAARLAPAAVTRRVVGLLAR